MLEVVVITKTGEEIDLQVTTKIEMWWKMPPEPEEKKERIEKLYETKRKIRKALEDALDCHPDTPKENF